MIFIYFLVAKKFQDIKPVASRLQPLKNPVVHVFQATGDLSILICKQIPLSFSLLFKNHAWIVSNVLIERSSVPQSCRSQQRNGSAAALLG